VTSEYIAKAAQVIDEIYYDVDVKHITAGVRDWSHRRVQSQS